MLRDTSLFVLPLALDASAILDPGCQDSPSRRPDLEIFEKRARVCLLGISGLRVRDLSTSGASGSAAQLKEPIEQSQTPNSLPCT